MVATTVSVMVVFLCIPPPFPVTVIVYVPTVVLDPTLIVIVELPPPGAPIVPGLKLTVVPLGAPVADRPIELLNPPLTVVVIVEVLSRLLVGTIQQSGPPSPRPYACTRIAGRARRRPSIVVSLLPGDETCTMGFPDST